MPLYEFRCDTCGLFDSWRSLAEANLPAFCPTCDQPGRRIFSAPAVKLSSAFPSVSGRSGSGEPTLVNRGDREPPPARFQHQTCGRPWMLNH